MFAPVAAVFLSTALLLLLLRYPDVLVDRPNQRSLHHRPVPRTGGIAIVLGSLGASAAFLPDGRLLISLALAVSLVSLLDDWRGVAALPRFGAQLSVAAVFVRIGLGAPSIPESIFLVLTIVWVANLYNFMDGCDGLAGAWD